MESSDAQDPEQADAPHRTLAERRSIAAVSAEEEVRTADGRHFRWFGVYRYEGVRECLNDESLSACEYGEHMGLGGRFGPILLELDEPEHRRHRSVLQPAFTRSAIARHFRSAADSPVDDLLDDLTSAGSGDLLSDLCDPFPALVLTRMLGLTDADADALRTQVPVNSAEEFDAAVQAADALFDRLAPIIEHRARRPGDDLISHLATGSIGDRPLDTRQVFSHVRLLAIAGTDTASRATANLLFAMLTHDDQRDAVRGDHRLVPAAVEEAVRWECPAVAVPRVALRDTTIAGVSIPGGSMVRCYLAAANRDPDRWVDPDDYDVFREPKSHAGFGIGAHACLGIHLARHVMSHILITLLDRLPQVRLDPNEPPPSIQGAHVRSPTHLRVRWD